MAFVVDGQAELSVFKLPGYCHRPKNILGNWSADKWFVPGSPMKFATDVWGQLIQMPTIHNWEVRIQFLGAPN